LIPIVGLVALLAGCGSSSSSNSQLSYSAFSNAAEAICKTASGPAQAAISGVSATANAANAAKIDSAVKVVQAAVPKLTALSGPSSLESARDKFVSTTNQALALLQTAASNASSGNQAGYVSAITQVGPLLQQSNIEGSQLGAPNCAK
jgi:hypothetical protein